MDLVEPINVITMKKKWLFIFSLFLLCMGSKAQEHAEVDEIILVFKTHVDIGYTDLAKNVMKKYQTETIDKALDVVDRNRNMPADQQFVWTLPGWPLEKISENWNGQNPERLDRINTALQDGHFVPHALPFTTHTEMLAPECLVRGLGYSSKLARTLHKPLPTGAKMTDVPSHSWILPTLLKNAGVNFLHLGCNGASMPPQLPYLFWWEGPDGSRLLTMYSTEYGSELFPPKDWPCKTWLAMLMRGDNQGPPQPEELKQLLDKIHKEMPGVKVTVGELGDFGDRIMQENPELPVIKQDMPDTWIHGAMCDPSSAIVESKAVPDIYMGESLGTLLDLYGVKSSSPRDNQTIASAYESALLYYEHTWGKSMGSIAGYVGVKDYIGQVTDYPYGKDWEEDKKKGRFKGLEESWDEHSAHAYRAYEQSSSLLQQNLQLLADAVKAKGKHTVVYNALPWERDGIPAMGYTSFAKNDKYFTTKQPKINQKSGVLENKYFKIELQPETGSIHSVIDKQSGRELVDREAAYGFGQFVYERFSRKEVADYCKSYVRNNHVWGFVEIGKPNMPSADSIPYQSFVPTHCSLKGYNSENGVGLTMVYEPSQGNLKYPVSTSVILYGNAPYFDLEVTVEKTADPWPEAGWLSLPFKIDNPHFKIGRHGSIIDPITDFALPGVNRYLYAAGTGIAIFDEEQQGIGVCGMNTPLVSLSEPGCWKFDNDFIPTKPVVYYNLFNNNWSTNFRFWNEGKWTYHFRVWTYDQYDPFTSLLQPALEARYPLQLATSSVTNGKLPVSQSGITLSQKGVVVTAFGTDPDGNNGTLLRLWEQAGKSGEVIVSFPKDWNFSQAIPVNLRGEQVGEPLVIRDGKMQIRMGKFAPASFILK